VAFDGIKQKLVYIQIMKHILKFLLLLAFFSSCKITPMDVNFNTDPRILRGTWTGTSAPLCDTHPAEGVMNPTGTQYFAMTNSTLEVFDAENNKLGGFTLPEVTSKIVWSADGSSLVYLRASTIPLSAEQERVTVNPVDGTEQSLTPISLQKPNLNARFNNDLTRAAFINNSNQIVLYDLITDAVLSRKSIPVSKGAFLTLNSDGTKIAYTTVVATKTQVWLLDLTDDTSNQVFEGTTNLLQSVVFTTNHLNIISREIWDEPSMQRINLSNKSTQITKITLSGIQNAGFVLSGDGTRIGYIATGQKTEDFYVHNAETGVLIQKMTIADLYGPDNDFGFKYNKPPVVSSSNLDGTQWLLSGTRVGCTLRTYSTTSNTLSSNVSLITDDAKAVVMKFTPTYRDSSGYAFTGTAKIGLAPERTIQGFVNVPNGCELLSSRRCEKLVPASMPHPGSYYYTASHDINLTYENGDPFEYSMLKIALISSTGSTSLTTKTAQIHVAQINAGKTYRLLLDQTNP
jgi:hypothetical protein